MPRIPNTPVVLSESSYTILNGIRNTIGGEFRESTPLVEDAESLAAYGEVVMGSGHYRNQYIGLISKIAEQILLHYAYENPLKLLKRGVLQFGESVEIDWVRLTMPEGYTQSVAKPGDVFKTNNPEVMFTWHPVNSQLFYETTINENEIRMCFTSENGVQDLISVIIQRLYDSSEWDEQIVMQYLLARIYLDNKSKVAVEIPAVTKSNADDIVITQKKVSNDMRFMNTAYNIAGEATHTPVDKQVFLISSELSAVADVGSLAKAFNLEYNQFIGQSIMVDGFSFDTAKLARLDHIMQITAEQGLIPNYTPFTDEELAALEAVKGCIMDKNALVIYDRLVELRDVIDARHLNVNYYLHLWKIYSYNVFAQIRFFTTEDLNPQSEVSGNFNEPNPNVSLTNDGLDSASLEFTYSPSDAVISVQDSEINDLVTTSVTASNGSGTLTITSIAEAAGEGTGNLVFTKDGSTATASFTVNVSEPVSIEFDDPENVTFNLVNAEGINDSASMTFTYSPANAEITVQETVPDEYFSAMVGLSVSYADGVGTLTATIIPGNAGGEVFNIPLTVTPLDGVSTSVGFNVSVSSASVILQPNSLSLDTTTTTTGESRVSPSLGSFDDAVIVLDPEGTSDSSVATAVLTANNLINVTAVGAGSTTFPVVAKVTRDGDTYELASRNLSVTVSS